MKTFSAAAVLAIFCLASTARADISYSPFNYPDAGGGSTYLTGIRGDGSGSTGDVFMTGVFTPSGTNTTQGLIYRGPIGANTGTWNVVNFPSFSGTSVTSTALYGPNDLGGGTIRAVGSYKTSETGNADTGLLYEGSVNGSGTWTTLNATALNPSTVNTIAHSTDGSLVVGNYDTSVTGKAFVFNIATNSWYDLNPTGGSISITAYGIWHNGGTSYTIAGGFTDGPSATQLDYGYLLDWDSATQATSNFTTYNFGDLPVEDAISHFDGITTDGAGGYFLTGDYIGVGALDGLGFFAHIERDENGFGPAEWTQLQYTDSAITSGNSVFENYVIGIYVDSGDPTPQGYVALVPEPSTGLLLLLGTSLFLRRCR